MGSEMCIRDSARTVKLAKITSLLVSFSNEVLLQEFVVRNIRKENTKSNNFFFIIFFTIILNFGIIR